MTQEQLQALLSKKYDPVTWNKIYTDLFQNVTLFSLPKEIPTTERWVKSFRQRGFVRLSSGQDLAIFEVILHDDVNIPSKKVGLRNLVARLIDNYQNHGVLAVFDNGGSDYRFTFAAKDIKVTKEGIIHTETEARRYTYVLGENETCKTAAQRFSTLKTKGDALNIHDLIEAFSVEALNKEFYTNVARAFYKLIGATEGAGRNKVEHKKQLNLGRGVDAEVYKEFAVRLLGRIIFCWFLKYKKSDNEISLIPREILNSKSIKDYKNYYHEFLEPLFFQVLNLEQSKRTVFKDLFKNVPYLNGGLFDPDELDAYEPDRRGISKRIETPIIKNDWFIDFFQVLEQYNFTVDENRITDYEVSVDPEILGRIFENLLAEINPESEESARKATGSFYTPREIVDYMVKDSLTKYLHEETEIEEVELFSLFSDESSNTTLDRNQKLKVLDALDKVKILDAAAGSGAYPMGILHKMVDALRKVDPDASLWKERQLSKITSSAFRDVVKRKLEGESFDYIRKLGIIQNSIYGADILPIAREIARLRCFLSLIVDETILDDKPNRGILPLPNLDFKFVTANSLKTLATTYGAFEGDIESLRDLYSDYLQAFGDEKEIIKQRFFKKKDEIKRKMDKSGFPDKRAEALISWNPFSIQQTNWFDAQIMFGVSDGFDIVIGNPPYGGDKIDDEIKEELGLGSKDPYGAFIARFITKAGVKSLLKEGGILSFIVSDTFMTIKSHFELRERIIDNLIHKIIRVHPDTFHATVNTAIILIQKTGKNADWKSRKSKNNCLIGDYSNVSIHDNFFRFVELIERTINYSTIEYKSEVVGDTLVVNGDNWSSESSPEYAIYSYPQNLIETCDNIPFFTASPKLFAFMNDRAKRNQLKVGGKSITTRIINYNEKVVELVKLGDVGDVKQGLATGDNEAYLFQNISARGTYRDINDFRDFLLDESDLNRIISNDELRLEIIEKGISKGRKDSNRYFEGRYILPYDKGGESDSDDGWMPNYYVPTDYFIDWSEWAVKRLKTITTKERNKLYGKKGGDDRLCSRFQNVETYFIKGITFSPTGVYAPTFRIHEPSVYDKEGSCIFCEAFDSMFLIAIFSSKITKYYQKNIINGTVHSMQGDVVEILIPIVKEEALKTKVSAIIKKQKSELSYDYASNEQLDVDKLVYEAFSLDSFDITEIENWYARRYPKLSRAQKENLKRLGKSTDYLELYSSTKL